MDENIGYNGAYTGQEIDQAIGAVRNKETIWDGKQDKLTGVQGQVVGFDDEGDAVAMPAPDTGVTTFNGRTGAVTPQEGDYTAAMVGARASNWTPTAEDVGAVPTARTVNGKALSADITLSAGDVGARPDTWTPSAADVGAVPMSRTVNGKALSADITLKAADVSAIPASAKGTANGIAELDSTGRVPSTQLPSYVDDVLEYDTRTSFPATGEDGKIYVDEDTNRQYRWSGTQYVEISPSLALGETSSTAYRGDRGKIAYDHSQTTGNPHGTTASDVGARPNTWTPTADEVGARPNTWTPTAADVGAVPTDRTVNGKALGADISLSAADVGAATTADVNTAKPLYIHFTGENKMNLSADHTVDEAVAAYNAGRDVKAVYEGAIYELRSVAENPQASAEFDIVVANAIKVLFMVGGNTAINMTYDEKLDAYAPLLRTSTLTTAGWSGNSQTVSVLGVSADSDSQLIYVSPADKASATAWGEAGVFCSAQGANSLTFVCDSTPSASITVNISIQEAQT